MMKWEVITFVECGGCQYKGTKTEKNWGQGFVSGEYLISVNWLVCENHSLKVLSPPILEDKRHKIIIYDENMLFCHIISQNVIHHLTVTCNI